MKNSKKCLKNNTINFTTKSASFFKNCQKTLLRTIIGSVSFRPKKIRRIRKKRSNWLKLLAYKFKLMKKRSSFLINTNRKRIISLRMKLLKKSGKSLVKAKQKSRKAKY